MVVSKNPIAYVLESNTPGPYRMEPKDGSRIVRRSDSGSKVDPTQEEDSE